MTDSFLYRSLPAFTGLLVFMPACGSNDSPSTGSETDASTSGEPTTTSASTTEAHTTAPEDTSSSESSPTEPTTDDGTEDSGPTTCPDDAMCAKNLPEGWFGPFIMARTPHGEEAPECPAEFPDGGPQLLDGFTVPGPAECTCECDPSGGPSCYASFVLGSENSCYGCYDYYGCYNQVSEACTNVDVNGNARFNLFGGYYGGGNCTPDEEEHVPPINWESEIKTCELSDTPLSCQGDGICVPAPAAGFESVWCLYQQGDVGCPAGIFNTKHKFYMGAEDSRECSDCTCGSIAGNCNTGQLLIFEGPDCAGEPVDSLSPNMGCEQVIAGSVAVDYGLQGGCPVASPPHAMGTAEPTGVFTFCCTG